MTGVTLSSDTPSAGTYDGTDWVVPLPPGGSATLQLTLDVAANAPEGMFNLVADITAGGTAGAQNGPFEIIRRADIALSKTESVPTVIAGSGPGNLTHVVTVTNNGPSDASGLEITDAIILPSGVTIDSVTPSLGSFTDPVWSISTLPVGASETLTIVYTVGSATLPGTNVVGDLASVTDLNETDPVGGNDTAGESTSVITQVDIIVTKEEAVDPVVPGGTAQTYTVTVTNAGPSDAPNVVIMEMMSMPAGVTVASQNASQGTPPFADGAGGVVNGMWTVGTIAAGADATLEIVLDTPSDVDSGGSISNTALLMSVGVGPTVINPFDDSASVTSLVAREVEISMVKNDNIDPVIAGSGPGNLTYTLDVTNLGPSDATLLEINDQLILPAGVTVDAVTSPDGGSISGSGGSHTRLVDLDAGETKTLEVLCTVSSSAAHGATITNLAFVVTVTNNGPSDATSVVISDPLPGLPAGVTFIAANPSQGGYATPTWTIGNLASGATATLELIFTVGSSAPDAATVSNQAVVASVIETDTDNANDASALITATIQREIDIIVGKTESTDVVVAGSGEKNLVYVISARNAGPSDSATIIIQDLIHLPACVRLVGVTPTQGTVSGITAGTTEGLGDFIADWDLGVMTAGQEETLTLEFTVDACAAESINPETTISDQACLSGAAAGETVINTADDCDAEETDVDRQVDLALFKTESEDTTVTRLVDLLVLKDDDVDPVIAGDGDGAVNLNYTLTVINRGPSDASGVEVLDFPMLPADVTLVPPVEVTPGTMMVGTDRWLVGNVPADDLPAAPPQMLRKLVVGPSAVPGSNVIENAAIIDEQNEPETDLGNNGTTEYTSIITQADVDIVKTHDPDPVVAGTELVITLTVTNNGPSDAQNVVVTDVLPTQVTYLSDSCGGSFDGTTFTWNIGTLADEQTVSCDITVLDGAVRDHARGPRVDERGDREHLALADGDDVEIAVRTGGRMMRGYIIGFAVDADNVPVKWNHLTGNGTIVNYLEGAAWEYNTYAIRVLNDDLPHGHPITELGVPGNQLPMDGIVFGRMYSRLFFNFQAPGSSAFSGPRTVVSDTSLTLFPVPADLRQENDGPVTTKATFEIWNMNEVKFTGLHRCITCWDQTLLSDYNFPNHFLIQNLQTDHGTARIEGRRSQICDIDYDPGNNFEFPFPPGPGDAIDPRDLVSKDAALFGVAARLLTIDGGADMAASGYTLIGTGSDNAAVIKFDGQEPFEEAVVDDAGTIDLDLPLMPTAGELRKFVDTVIDLGK
ncbi:MAG: DUF11 domain-containing protein [Planctomycetes bacterium]|nr:DUF11 domain-containing protein [Planctomycetota bacterium]